MIDRIDGCLYEDLDRLKRFRLMDDDFMSKVFDHNTEATQLLLSIILERNDLTVHSVEVQKEFQAVVGHSVKFDVFATDENGKPYDIEIQRADRGASPQRARYNNSVLDTYMLEKGKDYKETKGGCNVMCKMMEDMRKDAAEVAAKEAALEKATETAMNMLKDNISPEKVALYCGLSLEEVEKIKAENNL